MNGGHAMFEWIYAEVNVVCIVLLLFLLVRDMRRPTRESDTRAFDCVVWATISILTLDLLWILVEGRGHAPYGWLNALFNALYMVNCGLVSYLWFLYAERKILGVAPSNKRHMLLLSLPLLVLLVMSFASPWTGWMFSIDANNVYHRGPLHVVEPICSYFYLMAASLRALWRLRNARSRQRRRELLTLAAFAIAPAVGGFIAVLFYNLPTTWAATTVSILIVYISFQGDQVCTDKLTGLANRRQFDSYLYEATEAFPHGAHLYLMLLDVDRFKHINASCGHPAGDGALIRTAQALKQACRERDVFLARYGGDEFAIAGRFSCEADVRALREAIDRAFDAVNAEGALPYRLTVSAGYAEFAPGQAITSDALVERASRALREDRLRAAAA